MPMERFHRERDRRRNRNLTGLEAREAATASGSGFMNLEQSAWRP